MSPEDRGILELFARRVRVLAPSAAVWAFGSRAHGSAHSESDLDLLAADYGAELAMSREDIDGLPARARDFLRSLQGKMPVEVLPAVWQRQHESARTSEPVALASGARLGPPEIL